MIRQCCIDRRSAGTTDCHSEKELSIRTGANPDTLGGGVDGSRTIREAKKKKTEKKEKRRKTPKTQKTTNPEDPKMKI